MTGISDPIARMLGPWSAGTGTGAVVLRLALAMLLSAVIGCERSSKRHAAGLRTFMLVTLAAAAAMILDTYIYHVTGNSIFILSAAAAVAAALISIHSIYYSSRNEIKGLTTAAGLWVSAFVGMAAGGGYYALALAVFAALLGVLTWMPKFEAYLKNRSNHFEVFLELKNSMYLQDFVSTIRQLGMVIDDIEQNSAYAGSGLSVYSIAITISSAQLKKYRTHREIIEALRTLEYINYIEEMHV